MKKRSGLRFIAFLVFSVLMAFCLFACSSLNEEGTTQKTYMADITFTGGSGKAHIESPVEITEEDGKLKARFVWSSKNYDYMIVNGVRYDNENEGGPSTFTVDIEDTEKPLTVIGDTLAMSVPHEIEYVIEWGEKEEESVGAIAGSGEDPEGVRKALKDAGFVLTEKKEPKYAKCFEIEKYGDISYIHIKGSGDYLLIPEETGQIPDLPGSAVIIKKVPDNAALFSTSAMDLIDKCGALDMIRFTGTAKKDWYIDSAVKAMEDGKLVYAGKYRSPDFELLLENDCRLVIENTMILHVPEIRSKFEELGIPVLVERSSYEEHPLGRLEWIRLYGTLFDREEEADAYYEDQLSVIEPLIRECSPTGKTAAFFHVNSNGLINVRKNGDYITKMIELAGGQYVPKKAFEATGALSTMNMQMEDFYEEASQADILIYNGTIVGEISSVKELIDKNELFADFKAVKNGQVWCTKKDLFQQTSGTAGFLTDLNNVFSEKDAEYTYLVRIR